MTFMEALKQAGPRVTGVRVSKHTYAQILADLDQPPNPTAAAAGVAASFMGIHISLSTFIQDGLMSLFDGDRLVDVVSLEATPSTPLDPDVRVTAIVQDETGAWIALDADGGVLWHLTEKGARDLSEQKGIPIPTR